MREPPDATAHTGEPDPPVPIEFVDYSIRLFEAAVSHLERIDTKALGILATVGVVTSFEALRAEDLNRLFRALRFDCHPTRSYLVVIVFAFHALAMLATIILSVLAISIQKVEVPASVEDLIKRYQSQVQCPGGKVASVDALRIWIARGFDHATITYREATKAKGRYVAKACWSLAIAVVAMALYLTFLALWGGTTA